MKLKHLKTFENVFIINEDGDGSGGASAAGSGDASGGTAYATKGGGLGSIQNATVSQTPGDPNGSVPGSGDVSVVLPTSKYTNNSSGNVKKDQPYNKMISSKMEKPPMTRQKFAQTVKKIKDKLGTGKVMSFQSFTNK